MLDPQKDGATVLLLGGRTRKCLSNSRLVDRLRGCFTFDNDTKNRYHNYMKTKHRRTLEAIFARPVRAGIRWSDIESLLISVGAEIIEREGSRVAVVAFGQVQVYHRPHPSPDTDKGAVMAVRKWLEANGVKP